METTRERLVRYLDDAWAVEKALVSSLKRMAEDSNDPEVRRLFLEHADVTWQQEEALEARIRELGEEPSGTKGWFTDLMGRFGNLMQSTQDEYDRTTQHLIKAFASENMEMAMYQAMASFANAVGDNETEQLARTHMEQEKQAAERIAPLIGPIAARPAQFLPKTESRAA